MKKITIFIIFFLLIVSLFFSCKPENKWDCFKGTGKIITEEISLTGYDSLYISGEMNINLIQDTTDYVLISGGENLLAEVDALVENGLLTLRDNNHCNWVRNYKKSNIRVDLHFSQLKKIIFRKAANLFSEDTLYVDTLIISVWSKIATVDLLIDTKYAALKLNAATGNYNLSGKTDFNYIYSIGYGNVYTDRLKAKRGYFYCNSLGKTTFWISEKLKLIILNSGNVYYRDMKPLIELEKKDYATGKILPLDS